MYKRIILILVLALAGIIGTQQTSPAHATYANGHDNSTAVSHVLAWTHGSPNTGLAPGFGSSGNGYYYLKADAPQGATIDGNCEVYSPGDWLIQFEDASKHVLMQTTTHGTGGRAWATGLHAGALYQCRISDIGANVQKDYAELHLWDDGDLTTSDCGGPGVVLDPNFNQRPMEPAHTAGLPANGCNGVPGADPYNAADPRASVPPQEQHDLGAIVGGHVYTFTTSQAGDLTAFAFYGHQGSRATISITDANGTIVNGPKWGAQTPNPMTMTQEYVGADAGVQPAGTYQIHYSGPSNTQHLWALVVASATGAAAAVAPTSLHGATIYPHVTINGHTYRGSAWQHSEFQATLAQDVAQAVTLHLATLRPTDYLDGASSPYASQVWANMDYLLSIAHANGIRVILDLSAYRNWRKAQGLPVYDAAAWGPFVRFVATRYTGNPAIAYIAIAGEIPAVTWAGSPTAAQYVAFFGGVAHAIHVSDPAAVISTGGLSYLNWQSGIPWQALEALPDIGMVAIHVYSQGDETVTIPLVAAWAAAHGKPWIVEEFGFKQSVGDSVRAANYARVYTEATAHGAVGVVCWNLGPEVASRSYDVNPQTPQTWAVVQE